MTPHILVTYASRSGATAGVAQAIGETLTAAGYRVEVRPVHEVADLTPYDAVVAGSAIRYDRWLPEALAFVERHQAQLAQKPFAAFLTCLALARGGAKSSQAAHSYLQAVRDQVQPVSEGLFAGTLLINQIPDGFPRLAFRLVTGLRLFREGDYRDWQAIRQWAASLPEKLAV